jgi:hypothetical protein
VLLRRTEAEGSGRRHDRSLPLQALAPPPPIGTATVASAEPPVCLSPLTPLDLHQATQHGHTGNTCKRAISVRPGHRVYESHVDRFSLIGEPAVLLTGRFCQRKRDEHDRRLPAPKMGISLRALASPCLSFPCKIPANPLCRLRSYGDLSSGGSPAPPGPRRRLFGKDAEERFGLCKDLRTQRSPIGPALSGKLASLTITRGVEPPRKVQIPCYMRLPASV